MSRRRGRKRVYRDTSYPNQSQYQYPPSERLYPNRNQSPSGSGVDGTVNEKHQYHPHQHQHQAQYQAQDSISDDDEYFRYVGLGSNVEPVGPSLSTDSSNSTTEAPAVIVRGEEIGIVVVVLLLWVGAIILFFNRWGKIRMLEPYQPKFCETHRPSCPMADVTGLAHCPVSHCLNFELIDFRSSPLGNEYLFKYW
jgi:hypothetical protein